MSAGESGARLALVELLALATARKGAETARRMEGLIIAMQNERDGHGNRRLSDEQIGLRVCRQIYGPGQPDLRVLSQGTRCQPVGAPGPVLPEAVTAQYADQARRDLAARAAEREAERLRIDAERRAAEAADAAQGGAA